MSTPASRIRFRPVSLLAAVRDPTASWTTWTWYPFLTRSATVWKTQTWVSMPAIMTCFRAVAASASMKSGTRQQLKVLLLIIRHFSRADDRAGVVGPMPSGYCSVTITGRLRILAHCMRIRVLLVTIVEFSICGKRRSCMSMTSNSAFFRENIRISFPFA